MKTLPLGFLFRKVAQLHPNLLALKLLTPTLCSVTYDQLEKSSNQLAQLLKNKYDVQLGDRIVITSKKTPQTFTFILACLKIGAAYTFVDRFGPVERLKSILTTLMPRLIVHDLNLLELLNKIDHDVEMIDLDSCQNECLALSNEFELKHFDTSTIAYIMFTSGSTGLPKGVAVPHSNLNYFIQWGIEEYAIKPQEVLTNVNSLFFDNSIFDTYMAFFSGATLLALAREELKNPFSLVNTLAEQKVNQWFSVPSLIIYLLNLKAIKPKQLPDLKKIIFGGEGFAKNKLKELFHLVGNECQLYNVYGPTETTCICSSYLISNKDFLPEAMATLAPLGKSMLSIFDYVILNENGSTTMVNEIGELYLGGTQVSAGYFNRPEFTANAFIKLPEFDSVFYKTGDLVRRDENGDIFFMGRKDGQIKFMGHRIELGEIEAALTSITEIKECAVVFKKDLSEQGMIEAYLVTTLNKNQIKTMLEEKLPNYMVPKKFHFMPSLPKNSNGKIDRKNL